MKMSPREAVDFVMRDAPGLLKRDKGHAPILFVFGEKENALTVFDLEDAESKQIGMLVAGVETAYLLPYCVAFVSEAWRSRTLPPDGEAVSDMPDREEVLRVVAENKEGDVEAVMIPFSRVGGEILLGEPIRSDFLTSHLLLLYWEGARKGWPRRTDHA